MKYTFFSFYFSSDSRLSKGSMQYAFQALKHIPFLIMAGNAGKIENQKALSIFIILIFGPFQDIQIFSFCLHFYENNLACSCMQYVVLCVVHTTSFVCRMYKGTKLVGALAPQRFFWSQSLEHTRLEVLMPHKVSKSLKKSRYAPKLFWAQLAPLRMYVHYQINFWR